MIKVFNCLRCEHEWASKQELPIICPKCKSPYWRRERGKRYDKDFKLAVIYKKRKEKQIRNNKVPILNENKEQVITHELQEKFNIAGRNDPCPCGATYSNGNIKKFKHCHGK